MGVVVARLLRGTWFEIDDGGKREGFGEIGVAALWHTSFGCVIFCGMDGRAGRGGGMMCRGGEGGGEGARYSCGRSGSCQQSALVQARELPKGWVGEREDFGLWVRRWCWMGGD